MRNKSILFAFAALVLASSNAAAAERSVTLSVPGMNCPSCPFFVSKVLKKVTGVKTVKTSLKNRTAVVVFDDAKTDAAALTKATGSVGYKSTVSQ